MSGTNEQQNSTKPAATATSKGVAYDLCRKVVQADGTEKLKNVGTVFIRTNGSGGVAWIVEEDGKKHELAIFARKEREGARAPRTPAAPATAA